jgi:DNA polymerase III alpha subunit
VLHRDMAGDIYATHAVRLGFRKIKGLSEEEHGKVIMQNRGAGYASVRDLWLRTGLPPRVIARLADADAFGSLGLTRRQALWAAKALGRVGDKDDDLPLFQAPASGVAPQAPAQISASREPDVKLPSMPLGEEVVNDYRFLELSLRAHPASFLRADLTRRGIIRNEDLRAKPSGARVTISGLVTIRQRPGSANGVIFMTKRMKRFEKKVPTVIALHGRVAKRPRVAAYLASKRRIAFSQWGIYRYFKELDG